MKGEVTGLRSSIREALIRTVSHKHFIYVICGNEPQKNIAGFDAERKPRYISLLLIITGANLMGHVWWQLRLQWQ